MTRLAPLLAVLLAAPAGAQMVTGADPEPVFQTAQGFGAATLETAADASPLIVGRMGGVGYGIFFYGCAADRGCNAIQFAAIFADADLSLEEVNRWNAAYRSGQLYVPEDGGVILNYSVNLDHGVSRRNLEDHFTIWRTALTTFQQEALD